MGRLETVKAYIGIKILLSDLILQINENNFTLIKQMLIEGCIEDSNDNYNDAFDYIVYNRLSENWQECKEFFINQFETNGSQSINRVETELTNGCLMEKYLLVPVKEILSSERWGYNRDGTNSSSTGLTFDLSINTEKYKEINHYETVFFIRQAAY